MRNFFEGIQYLFEEILFFPFEVLRSWDNWWGNNFINWLLVLVGFAAIIYWIWQLGVFSFRGEEDKSVTAHSFL